MEDGKESNEQIGREVWRGSGIEKENTCGMQWRTDFGKKPSMLRSIVKFDRIRCRQKASINFDALFVDTFKSR